MKYLESYNEMMMMVVVVVMVVLHMGCMK